MITALILAAYPYIVTGFLHLDGYMDVTDAVKSWRELERRREILKDSHVGSFAVIGIVLLLVAQFAVFASAPVDANYLILIFIPAVSRCCSALAVTGLKPMSTSQYADQGKPKSHMVVLTIILVVFLAAGFLLCGKYGFALIGGLIGYGLALRRAYKSLEGMNGDISGYALTIGELCAVAVYALL
jgi:adenosylcobinamide-GDP ribazoletransferase